MWKQRLKNVDSKVNLNMDIFVDKYGLTVYKSIILWKR